MKLILMNFSVSFLVIGFGLFGTGLCALLDYQETDLREYSDSEYEDEQQKGPVINPYNGYIFDFLSRGIDMTSQSLFGNLSLGALKKQIFKYNPLERVEATRAASADGSVVYFVPKFIKKFNEEISSWDEIEVYQTAKQLNRLLDATTASFERRNYTSQLLEASKNGASAVSIYFSLQWTANTVDISVENYRDYLEDNFVEAIQSLPEDYNEQTQGKFAAFIADYGMHYLVFGQFGGMLVMESKENGSLVDTLSVQGYKANLKANLARIMDFGDKDSYGLDETIDNDDYLFDPYHGIFAYGGYDHWMHLASRGGIKRWLDIVKSHPVLLDGFDRPISKLIEIVRPESNNKTARAFDKAIEVAFKKYRIRAYLGALKVVTFKSFGRVLDDQYNPVKLTEYFRSLLDQTDPNLDATYEDNANYAVESILNRQN